MRGSRPRLSGQSVAAAGLIDRDHCFPFLAFSLRRSDAEHPTGLAPPPPGFRFKNWMPRHRLRPAGAEVQRVAAVVVTDHLVPVAEVFA